ncbi:MAG: HAMP domain-containing sensor histidine kinase [Thermoleophilia bacterium]
MSIRHPSLRARLVLAFVAVVAITAAVTSILTSHGLHETLDTYLRDRATDAGRAALTATQDTYGQAGNRWTPRSLDLLAHDLAVTGYDYRLTAADGRTLLDTTKAETGRELTSVYAGDVRDSTGTIVARLEAFAFPAAVRTPTDERFASRLDRLHLIAALIAAAVAAIVGVITAAWLARPMDRMAAFARTLRSPGGHPRAPSQGPPELRQVGESLQRLATDLERQRHARHQLAQDLAHELRTPVMLIQSRLEAIQDGILDPGDQNIAALHATTLRLGRLIGEIEQLAQEQAEATVLHPESLDLAEAAAHATDATRSMLEQRDLTVVERLAAAPVQADPLALDRVITNLITNAAKYAPAGTIVTVETRSEHDAAYLSVHDEGGTLEGPEAQRVFERFFRGTNARASGGDGLGLGLTIARQLTEQMGGTLTLTAGDRDTRFEVRLPRRTGAGATRPRAAAAEAGGSRGGSQGIAT